LVAYLCLGDVGVYSSYYHLHALVRERGYETQAVAGVTSFCAAAARLGVPLCQGSEQLLVSPATAALPHAAPGEQMNAALMKLGSSVADLREELARHDGPCEAKVVASCGLPGERVYDSLEDAPDDLGYLSLALVRPLL
jgi:precorrin-2/cobalt-factor-2 C20-methyltransferase